MFKDTKLKDNSIHRVPEVKVPLVFSTESSAVTHLLRHVMLVANWGNVCGQSVCFTSTPISHLFTLQFNESLSQRLAKVWEQLFILRNPTLMDRQHFWRHSGHLDSYAMICKWQKKNTTHNCLYRKSFTFFLVKIKVEIILYVDSKSEAVVGQ